MRTNKVILIAGTRGTGKTDYLKNITYKMSSIFPKCLIVDTFDSEPWRTLKTYNHPERMNFSVPIVPLSKLKYWKAGIGRVFSSDTDSIMARIQEDLMNTFIIFEDATKYVGSTLTKDVRKFVLDSKQKNLDIVFVFHTLMAIPPELVRISDVLVLFKTGDEALPSKYGSNPEIERLRQKIKQSKDRFINYSIELN